MTATTIKKLVEFGTKLMAECPNNDCVIYLNVFKMYNGVTGDLTGCYLSERGRQVLEHEQKRLALEMEQMYLTNYAVRKHRAYLKTLAMQGTLQNQ